MKTLTQNPVKWRLQTLLCLDPEEVHELACYAAAIDSSYRLVIGRCLLALEENGGRKARGCSSSTHYGTSVLGVSARMARESKRVARALLQLPVLTLAAENGNITWSKLREIVRVASPETEEFWLKLCKLHDCDRLAKLVSATPHGQLPGDIAPDKASSTEFRCKASALSKNDLPLAPSIRRLLKGLFSVKYVSIFAIEATFQKPSPSHRQKANLS